MNFSRFLNICLVASCVLLLCLSECQSQLTFTPSWGGKRSQLPPLTGRGDNQNIFTDASINSNIPPSNCNTKIDSVLLIYRLIQNEAQKLLECNQQQQKI